MIKKRTISAFMISLIIFVIWFLFGGRQQPSQALNITIGEPDGVKDSVGEGIEFATLTLGDPWDYEQESDLLAWESMASDPVVADGMVNFTTASGGSRLSFFYQGASNTQDIDNIGAVYPIDATQYRWLSFRMNFSEAGHARLWWFHDQTFTDIGVSDSIETVVGWHTYVVDLANMPTQAGSWSNTLGMPLGLAIEPRSEGAVTGILDWVRLTKDNPQDSSLTISWTDLDTADATVEFYLDDDNSGFDGILIHTVTAAPTAGNFAWGNDVNDVTQPTHFPPGNYYIYAKINDIDASYSTGPLTIDQAPRLHFTAPSTLSGDDYATVVQGDPWDMNESSDANINGVASYDFTDGILNGTNTGTDPQIELKVSTSTTIDPHKYRYLTIRMLLDKPWTVESIRAFWSTQKVGVGDTESLFIYRGWHTYTLDLAIAKPGHLNLPWENHSEWRTFRVDPNSLITASSLTFHIDHIYLTAMDTANDVYNITWRLNDPDSTGRKITLYYDTDRSGFDGVEIEAVCEGMPDFIDALSTITKSDSSNLSKRKTITGSGTMTGTGTITGPTLITHTLYLPLVAKQYPLCGSTARAYQWDTSAVPSGEYYLYAKVEDGYNVTQWYSEAPLLIQH